MDLNCKEVTRHIASDGSVGSGWLYRLQVELHVFLCHKCRRYKKQMQAIGAAARALWKSPKEDAATLDRLQEQILTGVGSKNEDAEE